MAFPFCRRRCVLLLLKKQLQFLQTPSTEATFTKRTLYNLRPLSSWGAPTLPWNRYHDSPEELERIKFKKTTIRKMQKLERGLQSVVKGYLKEVHPKIFAIQSCHDLLNPSLYQSPSAPKLSTSSSASSSKQSLQLSPTGQTLLSLNGFERVSLPKSTDLLDLAEGVVAKPAMPRDLKSYLLFAQPGEMNILPNLAKMMPKSDKKNDQGGREYPEFVEDDITLYRVLENQAASFLDNGYNAYRRFVEHRINTPSKRIADWIARSGILSGKPLEYEKESTEEANVHIDEDNLTPITHLSAASDVLTGEPEPLENLLVLSSESFDVALYQQMPKSARIVALSYTLGHSSASTLVHASLVIFGALPLAYRSYKFAIDYPGLSQAVAASVALTISYGIYSNRVSAKANQSRIVNDALLHRLFARDDAVVLVLREGAISQVTRAILVEYYQQFRKSGLGGSKLLENEFIAKSQIKSHMVTSLVDPAMLAEKFGLILSEEKDNDHNNRSNKTRRASSLDDALSSVESFSARNNS